MPRLHSSLQTLIIPILLAGALAYSSPTDSSTLDSVRIASIAEATPALGESNRERDSLHWGRATAVASLASTAYLGSYALILKDGWWDQPDAKFHFFYDGEYAHNVDKLGHGFAGIVFAELFYDGFRWSGVGETKSLVLAGTMSGLTHLGIEIKDGYGPTWGFSVWDVIGGTLGGFYPLAKARVPAFQYIDLKYSYWRNTDVYWKSGVDHGGVWVDDYGNETFWLSLKVKRVLPEPVAQYWPRWLALAAGVSVRGTMEGGMWGPREYFAALDWDLQAAINPRTYAGSRWVRYLNYVKLPAPAVRVYPDPAVFWLYPVKF